MRIKKVKNPIEGQIYRIEELNKGEFICKIRKGIATKKVYSFEGYCKVNKAYEVIDELDFCADSYLKKGTKVFIAKDY